MIRARGRTTDELAPRAALDNVKLEPLAFSPGRALPTAQEIARDVIPSVVVLTCRNQLGTGFFVQKNTIVTNYHVTCAGDPIDVQMIGGERGQAFPTSRRSDRLDIAVLFTALEGKPLQLASAGA